MQLDKILFGYAHISKTGGTTLLTILRSSFGAAHCDVEPWLSKHHHTPFLPTDLRALLRVYPHLRSASGHHFKPFHDYESVCEVKHYAFLRDPISRCLSEFQYQTTQRDKKWKAEDYIKTSANAQTRFLCGEASSDLAIEIIEKKNIVCGLTERFNESLLLLNHLVFNGRLNCHYTRQKSAPDQTVRDAIVKDNALMDALHDCNEQDIALHKYVVENIYPKQLALYGPEIKQDLTTLESELLNRGFNRKNIFINRLYRNAIYKPSVAAYRMFQRPASD